jgi:hypothetical protein
MRKQMITLFAVIGALMLGLGIVLFVVFVIVYPAPGNAIATVDARLNEPFSLRYVSQGTKERVWIDLDCVGCENTLSASIVTSWSERATDTRGRTRNAAIGTSSKDSCSSP